LCWYWHANFIRLISISFFKPLYSTVEATPARGITDGTAMLTNQFEAGSKSGWRELNPQQAALNRKFDLAISTNAQA
jgi:hypothetical protein